jgi:2-oxoacid:acceptor oxidoreductase gamma subunit (pyruvate/2-ketoisovalerate family)
MSLCERLDRGDVLDLRGDGKAGGGLVLAVQAFGASLAARGDVDVQDWPLFSSARKGANVRAYLRVARTRVEATHQVVAPDIAILMNEAAARETDFAAGTNGAIYVVNTSASPEETARRHRLGGTVATIGGDDLGLRHLQRPLGNVAVFAALVRATGVVAPASARDSLAHALEKRRLPARLVAANLALFDEAMDAVRLVERPVSEATDHRSLPFRGYGPLPAGAQAALRSSLANHTAGYGRPGVRIDFADPESRCNGCTLCVVQCPDGIIEFTPDPARGAIVHGARFLDFCKVCRECVAACPLDLFTEVAAITRPEGAFPHGG